MSNLIVRQIPFEFDGVDFIWNPRNPEFALFANILSFQTIGFERFIGKSMRSVRDRVTDPELLAELIDFDAQEMTHSKAHFAHVRSMVKEYPTLQTVFDTCIADFDRKWRASSLEYRLAYSAIIEASSLPLYRIVIQHRAKLLEGGDPRVAALLLWHFCEEIEHRSSALRVYNHVVGKPFLRLCLFPDVGRHLAENLRRIASGIVEHVPQARGLDLRRAMTGIPRWAKLKMIVSLFTSQSPFYDPAKGSLPAYCDIWARRYAGGEDMRVTPIN